MYIGSLRLVAGEEFGGFRRTELKVLNQNIPALICFIHVFMYGWDAYKISVHLHSQGYGL